MHAGINPESNDNKPENAQDERPDKVLNIIHNLKPTHCNCRKTLSENIRSTMVFLYDFPCTPYCC